MLNDFLGCSGFLWAANVCTVFFLHPTLRQNLGSDVAAHGVGVTACTSDATAHMSVETVHTETTIAYTRPFDPDSQPFKKGRSIFSKIFCTT